MTEEEIKQATCLVNGKEESGTGWLITSDVIITAYHCVENAIRDDAPITVRFGVGVSALTHTATLGSYDKDLDVCLLKLSTPLGIEPIPFSADGLRPGEHWSAYGYPAVKLLLGHVVRGEIQQVLSERVHGIDLDLSVEPGTHISDYHGLSGSAFMVGSVCKGLLRLNVDSAIGAVSMSMLKPFLITNGILSNEPVEHKNLDTIGARPVFDALFESTISNTRGGYVFVDGSHGIGKSTYCQHFVPELPELDKLGVYQFTERAHGSTPAHQAQPEIFFDWANSLLSRRATGKPARLMELSYSQLIEKTGEVLQSLANRCVKAGKIGVLFIDGINEVAAAGEETLKRFIGLLPSKVPEGLVMVVTGVGLESIANTLGTIMQGAERLTLPTLDREIQNRLCFEFLDKEKATTKIIAALCDLAMGHPLYLRYLADLVNSGASLSDINELPVFSGSIQDYYETIWANLVPNADVVNLLGIIARLRWGIPASNLTSMLSPPELGVFPSTLLRVQHLLANRETTEIYHPSFSEFIIHKTEPIGEWVHKRITQFCGARESGDYGILNRVYHGLRGGLDSRKMAIQHCQQAWVDNSVLLGSVPDVLLSDIDETLEASAVAGTANDIIRLLLLSQRLTFRYNTLFVQSAELVALALISIGKTESALRHIVRNGRLVVSADEAFAVSHALTQQGEPEKALEILELVQREINLVFEKIRSEEGITKRELVTAVDLRLHAFSLAQAAGDDPPFTRFLQAIVDGFLLVPDGDFSRHEGAEILGQLTGEMTGARLCLEGEYRPFLELGIPDGVDLRQQLLLLLHSLGCAELHSNRYGVALNREKVDLVLSDIERVIGAALRPEDRQLIFIDTMIEMGAAPRLIGAFAADSNMGDGTLPLFDENRAVPAEADFESAMLSLRAKSFLETEYAEPSVQMPSPTDWEESLESMARAVAWCDAKSRKAMAIKDQPGLDAAWSFLANSLLPCFAFTLESRVEWEASYFIPEAVVPKLYRRVAKLMLDCFPSKATALLDAMESAFSVQFGLYNEGFREALQQVLRLFIEHDLHRPNEDKVFSLVLLWRDYVAGNVENRFELVPELLLIVPLLARLGASEEALRTYKLVLSFSMGPSWYKEDQLSMMTGALNALPATSTIEVSALAQIAGLLERATGEMTFQRFVRADKGNFIGQLCRRSLFLDAVMYFQHQSCGTLSELHAQATSGNLDRVSNLIGMRYPGAALEEQAALLSLLRNTREKGCWQLRWALLEVYQHGDDRHLAEWGREYANIITELVDRPDDFNRVNIRVRSIATAMNSENAWLLLKALVPGLPPSLRPGFVTLLEAVESKLDKSQIERLTSSFGLRDEGDEQEDARTEPEDGEDDAQSMNDRMLMPGTFGQLTATKAARAQIEQARSQLNRRNSSAAIKECIEALKTLQAGGWSVWSENHSGSDAQRIIDTQVSNADDLARLYGPLALEERHTQRWAIASHILSIVAKKIDGPAQAQLLAVAIDHVRQIVGDAGSEQFAFIGNSAKKTASEALEELLFWTLDHPNWERRDTGASMLLWLARADEGVLSKLANLAGSMEKRNRADIATAILDILSREDAVWLWRQIEPHLEVSRLLENCRHVGRFVTLLRIAERASKHGVESAQTFFHALQAQFPDKCPTPSPISATPPPNFVPPTLHELWHDLSKLGLLTEVTRQEFHHQMAAACSPLTVNTACELESLTAVGGREDPTLPTGRWASIIRFALNVALFQKMDASQSKKTEALLRTYNPETLVEPDDGGELINELLACLKGGSERNYKPSHGNLVFLDFQCFLKTSRHVVHVELTSHLTSPSSAHIRPAPPTFKATQLARPGPDEPISVCGRALPTIAYFGCVSPAIPTPRFLELLKAKASDTVRYHWRNAGAVESAASSRRHETTLLAIDRRALALPPDWKIQWVLRVNGNVQAILNKF